jgi:hypothetical protein
MEEEETPGTSNLSHNVEHVLKERPAVALSGALAAAAAALTVALRLLPTRSKGVVLPAQQRRRDDHRRREDTG